jgi:hypothetical protein
MSVEDAPAIRNFVGPSYIGISPTGGHVCYTIEEANRQKPLVGKRYVRYDGELHWPGGWCYANRLDYTNRVLKWFDRYLGVDGGAAA